MRLKQIKLVGFKSFVDATKVPFEQQMTAIVGPNGCGKSNIIDAVRWVLGESSAKNLRGDAMTDVIFNGAASRKPIGQASVELIFENSTQQISPSLAQHLAERNEISVRRVVNRESINSYYLNGSKCRRKDITDIFLGTGLGPRSYAIIEQGTISRLIESKPQELRVFIEEAAGISKYKERRRDTENRIKHTRENLERLGDIRFELGQQIEKLDQQAQAAKRYRTLKASERKFTAELAVLRWQKFSQQAQEQQNKIKALQQQIEQCVVEQIACDQHIEQIKQVNRHESEQLQSLQHKKVASSQQAIRLEQSIKHAQSRIKVVNQELAKHETRLEQLSHQLLQEQTSQQQVDVVIEAQSPLLKQDEAALAVLTAEIAQLKIQSDQSQQVYLQQAKAAKKQLVEKSQLDAKIHHQKLQLSDLTNQINTLEQQAKNDTAQTTQETVAQDVKQLENIEHKLTQLAEQLNESTNELAEVNNKQLAIKNEQNATTWQIEHLTKTTLSLEESLKHITTNSNNIFAENSLNGPLYEQLKVCHKWQQSVEKVLGYLLHSQTTELALAQFNDDLVNAESVLLLKRSSSEVEITQSSLASVVDGISFYPYLAQRLNNIVINEDLNQAKLTVSVLSEEQSVICPEGHWLSTHFINLGQTQEQASVLEKQTQIEQHKKQLTLLKKELAQGQESLLELEKSGGDLQSQVALYRQQQLIAQNDQQKLSQQIALTKQALLHQAQQQAQSQRQLLQCKAQYAELEETLTESIIQVELLADNSDSDLSELEQSNTSLNQTLSKKQQQLIECQQSYHQHQVALETALTKQQSATVHKTRLEEQIHSIESQMQALEFEKENLSVPLQQEQDTFALLQQQLLQLDEDLQSQQQQLADEDSQIKQYEAKKAQLTARVESFKDTLNKHHIQRENYQLRAETALETLSEPQTANQILANMPKDAQESLWQANIIRLTKDISHLGAINLAAIDEFEAELARKQYLDQQDQDLNQALKTLESAIAKIDKESRAKFKTTFDQVNHDLQKLFPKVFGGGSAYLDLTGEDLLETGVTIMARPPGKKNSTIHLLSGGEKALTALSLVFAIFRLNPAPFCMLDEVDAPLDDANVERFCNLVREMSRTVQFIYISHNKIAMEMASQLTGVTMYEPGVSRMVAVDIDEAVAMAELP